MGGTGTDPVVDGLVKFQPASRQSHGCVGVFNELIAKQMGVLHELVPAAGTIAILDNSANPSSDLFQPHFGGASQSVCRISSLPIEGSERVVELARERADIGVGPKPDFLLGLIAAARLPGSGISETAVNASLAFIEGAKPRNDYLRRR